MDGVKMTSNMQQLRDTSELVEFFKPQCLYLKPIARVNITVTLPQLKNPGQAISNWDLMERIKKLCRPTEFDSIRVTKSTIEFVRFEADVDNKVELAKVVKTLDNASLKMIGFFESLKVKACEAKSEFPTRHDWDTFFRDSNKMNEMHPGERPDTVYLAFLPCKWFLDLRQSSADRPKDQPSEFVMRRVFETFGDIRCVDIPMCDKYRRQMSKSGFNLTPAGSTFGAEVTFEAYVQFVEYISFQRCMDALRNMKLVHIEPDSRAIATNIRVDFDKSKHLSDKAIRRRRIEREKLIEIEKLKVEEEAARRAIEEAELQRIESIAGERRRQREEKRRLKGLQKTRAAEEHEMETRIRTEERRLIVAQRKLEAIRVLTQVLKRVQTLKAKEEIKQVEEELKKAMLREAKLKKLRQVERDRRAQIEALEQHELEDVQKTKRAYEAEDREARGDRWPHDKYRNAEEEEERRRAEDYKEQTRRYQELVTKRREEQRERQRLHPPPAMRSRSNSLERPPAFNDKPPVSPKALDKRRQRFGNDPDVRFKALEEEPYQKSYRSNRYNSATQRQGASEPKPVEVRKKSPSPRVVDYEGADSRSPSPTAKRYGLVLPNGRIDRDPKAVRAIRRDGDQPSQSRRVQTLDERRAADEEQRDGKRPRIRPPSPPVAASTMYRGGKPVETLDDRVNKLKLPERRAKRVEPMAIEDPEKVLGVDPIDPEEFERERRKQKKHKKRHHRDEVVAKFDDDTEAYVYEYEDGHQEIVRRPPQAGDADSKRAKFDTLLQQKLKELETDPNALKDIVISDEEIIVEYEDDDGNGGEQSSYVVA